VVGKEDLSLKLRRILTMPEIKGVAKESCFDERRNFIACSSLFFPYLYAWIFHFFLLP